MQPILHLENVSVGYQSHSQQKVILDNLTIDVLRGELIGIVGQNGIGKSTLLRTIAKLQKPLGGKVWLDQCPMDNYEKNEFARKLSFVSTENIRLSHCTVREMIAFGRYPYTNWMGKLTKEDKDAVEEAIQMVGLYNLAERYINEISDGERQRVMIARTLAQNTDIIVLDEPTAFLDLPNRFEIVHLLSELCHKNQKTILFSSHDLNIAMKVADKLWLIMNDEFLEGAPEDLVLQHSISRIFKNSRLKFDSRKGEFSIQRNPIGYCTVNGHGNALFWTKKTLERLGFDVENSKKEIDITLTIHDKENQCIWEVLYHNKTIQLNSLYEVASYIKSNFNLL